MKIWMMGNKNIDWRERIGAIKDAHMDMMGGHPLGMGLREGK